MEHFRNFDQQNFDIAFIGNTLRGKVSGENFDESIASPQNSSDFSPVNVLRYTVLVKSLVFSHLSYAIFVWGVSLKQNLAKRLEHLQNRAVCLPFCLQKFDHIICYYRRVGWLPLSELIQYHSLCVIFHQFMDMAGVIHWSPRFSSAGLLITMPELKISL